MASDRVDVINRALDAIARRDLAAILGEVDAEIEVHPLVTAWQRAYQGHDGIEQCLRDLGELWDEFRVEARGFRDLDADSMPCGACTRQARGDTHRHAAVPCAAARALSIASGRKPVA